MQITINNQTYEFKDDLTLRELDELGDEPNQSDAKAVNLYNRKRLIAFSTSPKLTNDDLLNMPSLLYSELVLKVLGAHGKKMTNLIVSLNPKPKEDGNENV